MEFRAETRLLFEGFCGEFPSVVGSLVADEEHVEIEIAPTEDAPGITIIVSPDDHSGFKGDDLPERIQVAFVFDGGGASDEYDCDTWEEAHAFVRGALALLQSRFLL